MSVLIPMIRGYLFVCEHYDKPSQREYRIKEADRIAPKIREVFGRFDERDEDTCASRIKAFMKTNKSQVNQVTHQRRETAQERYVREYWRRENLKR